MTEIGYKQKNCLECQNKKIKRLEFLIMGLFFSFVAVGLVAIYFYYH